MNHLPLPDPVAAAMQGDPSRWDRFADWLANTACDWFKVLVECAGEFLLRCLSSLLD